LFFYGKSQDNTNLCRAKIFFNKAHVFTCHFELAKKKKDKRSILVAASSAYVMISVLFAIIEDKMFTKNFIAEVQKLCNIKLSEKKLSVSMLGCDQFQ